MMNILPDLKICQEARDKGVVIESEYYWYCCPNKKVLLTNSQAHCADVELDVYEKSAFIYPAPLTDEILKVLPDDVDFEEINYCFSVKKTNNLYLVGYGNEYEVPYSCTDKKLSNALLKLAIELKKNFN